MIKLVLGVGCFVAILVFGQTWAVGAAPSDAVQPNSTNATQAVGGAEADTKALATLQALEERYRDVRTVKGKFSQITVDTTFGEKIESQGTFLLKKPNRLRVDYAPPHATTLLISDGYSYRYVPQLKQVERYRIDPANTLVQTNYMLLGFGAATQDVLRAYQVSSDSSQRLPAGHTALVLKPRHPDEAPFKNIRMVVDTKARVPVEFHVTQLDGTQVVVKIATDELQVGAPIEDRFLRPAFPPDAQIVDIR